MRTKITERELKKIAEIRNELIQLAYGFDDDDIDLVNNNGSVGSHIDTAISSLNTILHGTTPINIEL